MKVLISYKRNVDPDQQIACRVFQALQQAGHSVFIDRTLTVGQEWAREIERQVREADFIIPFLTAASSHSEMVKGEIEIARDQAGKNGGSPRLLPVRLGYAAAFPYPLNAWLDPIQYATWRGEEDTEKLVAELVAAVGGAPLPSATGEFSELSTREGPPLYSAPLPSPGGSLDVDDPRYIRRETDAAAARLISLQGTTFTIKGSRQMGKSSLLIRALAQGLERTKRCALIDFQLLGKDTLQDSNTFFRRFVESIAEQLELPSLIGESWDAKLSDSQNCTRIVERHILQRLDAPVVVAIDEADHLFEAAFRNDFFGMLRAWHNTRANPLKKVWKKLDLVLVTSTEPYLFIDRPHESPFNVGEVLQLRDFSQSQIQELNILHDSPFFNGEIEKLHELLRGQPYLTRKAFYAVKSGLTPNQLFERAAEDSGPFGDHLRNYFLRLLDHPELATALKQIAMGRDCSDGRLIYRLEAAGLVTSDSSKTVPRCRLYADYFGRRL